MSTDNTDDPRSSETASRLREMLDEGVLTVVGSAYPAMAASAEAKALIDEHGIEFGPWQLNERGDKTDGPWCWLLVAIRPDVRAALTRLYEEDQP